MDQAISACSARPHWWRAGGSIRVRKLFRMLRSRSQQHNQHLWPFVRIQRDSLGTISGYRAFGRSVRRRWTKDTTLRRNRSSDPERPFHRGNPYDRMNIQCAMGVNGAIVLANKYDLPFKYYCIIDQNFVRDRIALVREIVSRDLTLYVSPEVLRYIVRACPRKNTLPHLYHRAHPRAGLSTQHGAGDVGAHGPGEPGPAPAGCGAGAGLQLQCCARGVRCRHRGLCRVAGAVFVWRP